MELYGYWRSSAAYRVRIVLNFLKLDCQLIPVHLVKDGGEQHTQSYKSKNPNALVPCLIDGDVTLNQSLAIIDYLQDKSDAYDFLQGDKYAIKAFAYDIACEIHPVNNLRIQQYLANELSVKDSNKMQWVHHWMHTGFKALEAKLEKSSGLYCFGDVITLADVCLIPQVYNALRFKLDMSAYPNISRIYQACNELIEFDQAKPENQADAT